MVQFYSKERQVDRVRRAALVATRVLNGRSRHRRRRLWRRWSPRFAMRQRAAERRRLRFLRRIEEVRNEEILRLYEREFHLTRTREGADAFFRKCMITMQTYARAARFFATGGLSATFFSTRRDEEAARFFRSRGRVRMTHMQLVHQYANSGRKWKPQMRVVTPLMRMTEAAVGAAGDFISHCGGYTFSQIILSKLRDAGITDKIKACARSMSNAIDDATHAYEDVLSNENVQKIFEAFGDVTHDVNEVSADVLDAVKRGAQTFAQKSTTFVHTIMRMLRSAFPAYHRFIDILSSIIIDALSGVVTAAITRALGNILPSYKRIVCMITIIAFSAALFCIPSFAASNLRHACAIMIGMLCAWSGEWFGAATTLCIDVLFPRNRWVAQASFKQDLLSTVKSGLCCVAIMKMETAGMDITDLSPKNIEDMMKRTTLVGRTLQAWDKISEFFESFIDDCCNLITTHVMNLPYYSTRRLAEIDEFCEQVMALVPLQQQMKVGRDVNVATRIESLYARYVVLRTKYVGNRKAQELLAAYGPIICEMYEKVINKNPFAHCMRKEPVCVAFWGRPGVGKTYLLDKLKRAMLKICNRFDKEMKVDEGVYQRCAETEFWDGYAGQPIVIVDDFGQKVDSLANPNIEFFELIRAINIFPYQLHSANLHEKANNPFNSEFVVLTSNVNLRDIKVKSIMSNAALIRRMHLRVETDIIEEVRHYYDVNGQRTWRLDVDRLRQYRERRELPDNDMSHYVFNLIDNDDNILDQQPWEALVVKISKIYQKNEQEFIRRRQQHDEEKDEPLPAGAYSKDGVWNAQAPYNGPAGQERNTFARWIPLSLYINQNLAVKERIIQTGVAVTMTNQYHHLDGLRFATYEDYCEWFWVVDNIPLDGPPNSVIVDRRVLLAHLQWERAGNPPFRQEFAYEAAYAQAARDARNGGHFARMYFYLLHKWRSFRQEYLQHEWVRKLISWGPYILASTTVIATAIWLARQELDTTCVKHRPWTKRSAARLILGASHAISTGMLLYDWLASVRGHGVPVSTAELIWHLVAMGGDWVVMAREELRHQAFHLRWTNSCVKCHEIATRTDQLVNYAPDAECELPMTEDEVEYMKQYDFEAQMTYYMGSKRAAEKAREEQRRKQEIAFEELSRMSDESVHNDESHRRKDQHTFESVLGDEAHRRKDHLQLENCTLREMLAESSQGPDGFRKKGKKFDVEAPRSDQAMQIIRRIAKNQLRMYLVAYKQDAPTVILSDSYIGQALAVGGRVVLFNHHYLAFLKKHAEKLIARCGEDASVCIEFRDSTQQLGARVPHREVLEARPVMRGESESEFLYLNVPSMPVKPSLLRNWMPKAKLCQLQRGDNVILSTFRSVDSQSFTQLLREGQFQQIETVTLEDDTTGIERAYANSGVVKICSEAGDCGGVYVANENRHEGKILGLHFAGQEAKGSFSVLSREDIEVLLRGEKWAQHSVDVQPPPEDFPLGGSISYIGKVDEFPFHPNKTKFRPSVIYDQVRESTVCPSDLGGNPLDPEGPMVLGLRKNSNVVPLVESWALSSAQLSLEEKLMALPVEPGHRRVLTFAEGVMGVPGDDAIPPLKRNKSAGYPYMMKTDGHQGKTKWLGSGQYYDFNSEGMAQIREDVNTYIEQASHGEVPMAIFVDTLKDETRPIEKVRMRKTRAFSACPLHLSIVFRMYFGGFLAFMKMNRIDAECCVGINAKGPVHANEWTKIARKLNKFGEGKIFAGDFSNFDGSVNKFIFDRVFQIIQKWYGDSRRNQLIRSVIWENISQAYHLVGEHVYQVVSGQPSGNPGTAVFNSLYVSLAMRYVYATIFGSASKFNEEVSLVDYGDDVVGATRNPEFNPQALTLGLARIGMTFTNERKTEQGAEFRRIDEIDFLKRQFVWDENLRIYKAPLSLDSILEMTNWISRGLNPETATVDNCVCAILELHYHDKATYDYWSARIRSALLAKDLNIPTMSWEEAQYYIAAGTLAKEYSVTEAFA